MLAVNISAMFEEGISDAHKEVLRRLNYEELKGLLTFFGNRKGTVEAGEIACIFYDSSTFDSIVFDMR